MSQNANEELRNLRRQWEMIRSALPPGDSHEKTLLSLPVDRRDEFREKYEGLLKTRDEIADRIALLEEEASKIASKDEAKELGWQNLLFKLALFGWTGPEDFPRLESRMPRTWPGATLHASVGGWLPFAEWCRRHWIGAGRVACALSLEAPPELLEGISPPLRIVAITSSQHHHNLTGFLKLYSEEPKGEAFLHPLMGETGHAAVMNLPHESVQAVLIGRLAWEKWRSLPPAMLKWMLRELADRTIFLAVETPDESPITSGTGWISEQSGPDRGDWKIWRVAETPLNGTRIPFSDARCRVIRMHGAMPVLRRSLLGEDSLTIIHQSNELLTREKGAWESLQGLHPMIPALGPETHHSLSLTLPPGKKRWMPCGRMASTDESLGLQLADLFRLLSERKLMPPGLGVHDFLATGKGPLLTRIGFQSCSVSGDPLPTLVETLSSWHLLENSGQQVMAERPSFPPPFRRLGERCLSALSIRDLMRSRTP